MYKNKIRQNSILNSLKGKIISIILTISGFTTIVGLLLLYSFDIPKRHEELKNNASLSLAILAENSALPLYSFDKEQLNRIIESSSKQTFIINVTIITTTHDTIVNYTKPGYKDYTQNNFLLLSQDIKLNNELLGIMYIAISKESLTLRSRDYLITSTVILALTIIISLILGLKLQTVISNPIINLSHIARKISATNDYNIKIINETNDETGILYDEFNKMITEIKNREEELSNARKFLTDVLNSMPSALVTVNPELKIISINEAAIKLSTVDQETLKDCPLRIAFPLFQDQFAHISASLEEKKDIIIRKIEKNINGKRHFFDVGFYPLSNSEGIVVRMDEVTKQAGFENLVMQTEKIMSVGGLAAGMAHEINNPLGVMIQTAQNIERRISPDLKANKKVADEIGISIDDVFKYLEKREIIEFIEDIKKSGARAAEIVKNMLKFSHKSDSTHKPLYVTNVIDNSIKLAGNDFNLKKKYDFKDVEIVKEYSNNIPEIDASETELEQVFLNILKNCVQAMSVEDKESKIIIRVLKNNGNVRIEIEDNGPGIDRETRKHLFEPFYTTKPVGEGTGLGLSVSYMIIVKNHKGIFDVESHIGKGTKFIIELPLKE